MQFRRTKIIDAVLNYNMKKLFKRVSCNKYNKQGYIKRSPLTSLKAQRIGKEKPDTTREEDFVVQILANTHTPMLFSTQGLVYKIKAYKIPEGTSASKGSLYLIFYH